MILYLDSSALVKLYKPELHSIETRRLVEAAKDCVTTALAEVEVRGALARAHRGAGLAAAEAERLKQLFVADFARMTVVEPIADLLHQAADLAERHYLRAYDAVHLASALRVASETGERVQFLAFDDALNAAAVQEGLVVA